MEVLCRRALIETRPNYSIFYVATILTEKKVDVVGVTDRIVVAFFAGWWLLEHRGSVFPGWEPGSEIH